MTLPARARPPAGSTPAPESSGAGSSTDEAGALARATRAGRLLIAIVAFTLFWSCLPTTRPFDVGAIATWLAGIAAYVAIAGTSASPAPEPAHATPMSRPRADVAMHVALVAAILAVAAVVRLVALEDVPPIVHGDEGESALMGLAIVLGRPEAPPFFGTGWLYHPALHFYFEALSIRAFGVTLFAARLVSAVWGVATVAATYAAGRALVNARTGLVAAALASTAPVMLHLSRFSLDNVETVTLGCTSIVLFASALRAAGATSSARMSPPCLSPRATLAFALAGVCAGFTLFFYEGSWAVAFILAIVWGATWWQRPRCRDVLGRGAAVAAGGLLVAALPLLVFLVRNPDASGASRAFGELFVPTHLAGFEQQAHASSAVAFFVDQGRLALGQFFFVPDQSGFYPFGAPILLAPVAGLFAAGIVLAFARARSFESRVLLTWLAVTLILGNVLFGLAPYTPRIVGALPAVFVVSAAALDWVTERLGRVSVPSARIGTVGAVAFLVAVGATSLHDYFTVYFQGSPAHLSTSLVQFIGTLPPGAHVYGLAKDFSIAGPHERYVGYRVTLEDVKNPDTSLSQLHLAGSETAFVLLPPYTDALPAIEQRFPGGAARADVGSDGHVAFVTYVVR